MESIQLAQLLADLNDLSAAQEADSASSLVTANKTLVQQQEHASLKPPEQRHHKRTHSADAQFPRNPSPPAARSAFDRFGRKILTPPISRTTSAQNSIPGTPRHAGGPTSAGFGTPNYKESLASDPQDDVERASTLMALHDLRARIRQQDNSSLNKARDKVSALAARQHQQQQGNHHYQPHQQPTPSLSHEPKDGRGGDARRSVYQYPKSH